MTVKRRAYPKKKKKKTDSWGTANVYRGDNLRSNWETYAAKLILYAGFTYEYEHRRYQLGQGISYLPDFYIPELQLYVEVKGILLDKDKVKLSLFKQRVTSRILYLGKAELEYIFGGSSSTISKLDYKTYIPTQPELIRFRGLALKIIQR